MVVLGGSARFRELASCGSLPKRSGDGFPGIAIVCYAVVVRVRVAHTLYIAWVSDYNKGGKYIYWWGWKILSTNPVSIDRVDGFKSGARW